jgi:hypothetical protein
MVPKLRSQRNLVRVAGSVLVVIAVGVSLATHLRAEAPPVHYQHGGIMPPGAIGNQQLQRGGPLPGYFQPVEIRAPGGALISTAGDGGFDDPQPAPLVAGLLIGSVYRLRISGIPLQEGMEVYPTIEVIDRLYPPPGQEYRFPIMIELTQEELEMALDCRFVTRVVYLEDPDAALPVAERADEQSYFEAGDGENPLDVADSLGRPVAIVRMGGRVPDASGPDATFLYGSPPMLKWKAAAKSDGPPQLPQMVSGNRNRVRQASAVMPVRKTIKRVDIAR